MELFLAFCNIFGGILLILILSLCFSRFDKWIFKKFKYNSIKINLFYMIAIFIIEILIVFLIILIYNTDFINTIFVFSFFLLFMLFVVPYHAALNLNTEAVYNKNYIDRSTKLDIRVSNMVQSPFLFPSLLFVVISFLIILIKYLL